MRKLPGNITIVFFLVTVIFHNQAQQSAKNVCTIWNSRMVGLSHQKRRLAVWMGYFAIKENNTDRATEQC